MSLLKLYSNNKAQNQPKPCSIQSKIEGGVGGQFNDAESGISPNPLSSTSSISSQRCLYCSSETPGPTSTRFGICVQCKASHEATDHRYRQLLQERKSYRSPNYRYRKAKKAANYRGHIFTLSKPEYSTLIASPCHFCGEVTLGREGGLGLTRINPDYGYVPTNVLPACGLCNLMKHSYTPEFFLNHLQRILTHLGAA